MKNTLPLFSIQTITAIFFGLLTLCSTVYADTYHPLGAEHGQKQAPYLGIKNAKQPFAGILTAGQPGQRELAAAKEKGFKTIINLRMPSENSDWDEAALVKELGMKYISIPVAGAAGLTANNQQTFTAAITNAANYPILVHCASSNRVGAFFALDANQRFDITKEQAIVLGESAGLSSLKTPVTSLLK